MLVNGDPGDKSRAKFSVSRCNIQPDDHSAQSRMREIDI